MQRAIEQGREHQAASPRVSIVIVTYRSREFIDRCIAPLANQPEFEIVAWENASGDGLSEHVREVWPRVRMYDSSENLGFAQGNNRAFERCSGRYILLLNPDAFVESPSVIRDLANYLDNHPDVAAVGPRLVNEDGSHQIGDAGWRISFASISGHALMIQRLVPNAPGLYLTNKSLLEHREVDVDWVCGACMMVRSEVVDQVGGMDEDIFMYGEDVEWGTRMRDAGWRVIYLPVLSVLHLQGATQKNSSSLFVSTKWLDNAVSRYARTSTHLGYEVLRAALVVGFAIRASVWLAGGLALRRIRWREKARAMLHYAMHAAGLPSYSEQRGNSKK